MCFGKKKGKTLASICDIVPCGSCDRKTTFWSGFVASVQRQSQFLDESFAQSVRVWFNTYNFLTGGWPGNPVGERT
jgi:hypothetical protein